MVETSLVEVFSGDVPRIDNMVIVLDQAARVKTSSLLGWSAQLLGNHLVGFNLAPIGIRKLEEFLRKFSPPVNFVLIVKAGDSFRIERGEFPECYKGKFFLEYRVSFEEKDLPTDRGRISRQMGEIKELQAELDKGLVGFTAYGITGILWARVQGLNQMIDSRV